MAKRGVMCADCCYLDKAYKYQMGVMFQYGCRCHLSKNNRTHAWLSSDSGLKRTGCSCCNKLYYGTVFQVKGSPYKYIYLGKEEGKRCLYNISKKETEYVTDGWIVNKSITALDYHNLYVIYRDSTTYDYVLCAVENLLRFENEENKQLFRDRTIIAVIRADGIKQARERKQKVVEKWENENLLPFN